VGTSFPFHTSFVNWNIPIRDGEVPVAADDDSPGTVVILAHGAGSHMEQTTMLWLSQIARDAGARVVRFNFLYRALGKGMPDRMPVLMETYRAVIESVRAELKPERLIIGGHSMGGRVASMVESEGETADGLLLFGYPLHPAGQPEKLRDAHLPSIKTRTLQFSGTNDALCTRSLMEEVALPDSWTIHWIEGADHSYVAKGRPRAELAAEMREALIPWLARILEL
jgi:predicted alpha/beta-hydrolase family hydrolase